MMTGEIPKIWKHSIIIPVPKKPTCSKLNDLRPISLTAAPMKCFEKLYQDMLKPYILPLMDPLQFAYRSKRSTEDAIVFFMDCVTKHLEQPKSYARALFIDYSSAFNTIIPTKLITKFNSMDVPYKLQLWAWNFLNDRTQVVIANGIMSSVRKTYTGAPQGCVNSPVFFTAYTNDIVSHSPRCRIIKYADDTVCLGLISNLDETEYRQEINLLDVWCNENNLLLNAEKCQELVFTFLRETPSCDVPVSINNRYVDIVNTVTYLGVKIQSNLKCDEHVLHVSKKCKQRMFFLRRLNVCGVDSTILKLFYKSIIESVASYCIISWYYQSTHQALMPLDHVMKVATKILREDLDIKAVVNKNILSSLSKIMSDESHCLHASFIRMRSGRLRAPPRHTRRFGTTFVPIAIQLYNDTFSR